MTEENHEGNIQSVNDYDTYNYQVHTATPMRLCTFPLPVGPSAQVRDLSVSLASRNGDIVPQNPAFLPIGSDDGFLANGNSVSNPETTVGNSNQ